MEFIDLFLPINYKMYEKGINNSSMLQNLDIDIFLI